MTSDWLPASAPHCKERKSALLNTAMFMLQILLDEVFFLTDRSQDLNVNRIFIIFYQSLSVYRSGRYVATFEILDLFNAVLNKGMLYKTVFTSCFENKMT